MQDNSLLLINPLEVTQITGVLNRVIQLLKYFKVQAIRIIIVPTTTITIITIWTSKIIWTAISITLPIIIIKTHFNIITRIVLIREIITRAVITITTIIIVTLIRIILFAKTQKIKVRV